LKHTEENIRNFVLGLIEKKGKLPESIDFDTFNYIETGYIDSISITKFILEIEKYYNIEITEEDMLIPEFKTIKGISDIIYNKLKFTTND
jgi:acyl carrier protein